MVLSRVLGRLARGAPVPVFVVAGRGAREAVQELRLNLDVWLTDSPRPANVLLVAGAMSEDLWEPLARVHDAMSQPRATVFWTLGNSQLQVPRVVPDALVVEADVATAIAEVHCDLLLGRRQSEAPALPDEEPAPWRGVGPYGQGGSGMTGGVPYGRPMAELAADRDGLRLDVLPLRVGPFFPRFPPGLQLDLKLAGDVVVEVSAGPNPFENGSIESEPISTSLGLFVRALSEPVAIANLELARARSHLRWVAEALTAHELRALGTRVLNLATRLQPGDGDAVRSLARSLSRTQVLGWATRGVGTLPVEAVLGLGLGPIARAAGLDEDLRSQDPGYRALGFEPIVQQAGDASARWRQRLDEAVQSLDLAREAGDRRTNGGGSIESPRGRLEAGSAPAERLMPLLPDLLSGLEWGDALATLVSLDLDLEEAGVAEFLAHRQVNV